MLVRDYEGHAEKNLWPTISVAKTKAVTPAVLRLIQHHARRLNRRNIVRWFIMVADRRPLRRMDSMESVSIRFSAQWR